MNKSYVGTFIFLLVCLFAAISFSYPTVFSYFLITILFTALAAFLLMVIYLIYWVIHNHTKPITRIEAKVLRRRKKDWDVTLQGDTPEIAAARLGMMGRNPHEAWKAQSKLFVEQEPPLLTLADGTNYFVTYAFDGKEAEFCVPESYYIKSNENTDGLLVFQGEQFKYFIPNIGKQKETTI